MGFLAPGAYYFVILCLCSWVLETFLAPPDISLFPSHKLNVPAGAQGGNMPQKVALDTNSSLQTLRSPCSLLVEQELEPHLAKQQTSPSDICPQQQSPCKNEPIHHVPGFIQKMKVFPKHSLFLSRL